MYNIKGHCVTQSFFLSMAAHLVAVITELLLISDLSVFSSSVLLYEPVEQVNRSFVTPQVPMVTRCWDESCSSY